MQEEQKQETNSTLKNYKYCFARKDYGQTMPINQMQ
jgi:hypothetical protein